MLEGCGLVNFEELTTSQGVKISSRPEKGRKIEFPPEHPERNSAG